MIPTMLVLPDAEGEELRRIVDQVMQQGGFDTYSTEVSQR
jgi:D-alanyl-D-alanine dipeptidase